MTSKLILAGLGVAGAALVSKLVGGFFSGIKQDAAFIDIQNKTEGLQAIRLLQAMNPSGQSWLMWGDGTDEQEVFAVAREITNLNSVQNYYRKISKGRRLIDDLKGELDSEDFNKFMSIVNGTGRYQLAKAKTEKKLFKYSHGEKLYANGQNVPLFDIPDPKSHYYPMLEENGFLGTVQERYKNRNGIYYGIKIRNKLLFVREEQARNK